MVSISFFPCMVLLHSDYLWSSIKMILHGRWDLYQTQCMGLCLFITLVLGIITILKGKRQASDTNDFQKILLAHAFSLVGHTACLSRVIFSSRKNDTRCWLSWMLLPMPFQDSFAGQNRRKNKQKYFIAGVSVAEFCRRPVTRVIAGTIE